MREAEEFKPTRSQILRADFRQKYHYYPHLRNWADHRANLDYLDNKSIGLLTISALLIAGFLIFVGDQQLFKNEKIRYVVVTTSAAGVIFLVLSVVNALECMRTLVDIQEPKLTKQFSDMENCFDPGQWRGREAKALSILGLLDKMTNSIEPKRAKLRIKAEENYLSCCNNKKNFDEFEELALTAFNTLREHVETEVEARHDLLNSARRLVVVSLTIFGLNILALFISYFYRLSHSILFYSS